MRDKDIRKAHIDGRTVSQIARDYNFSEDSVRGRISRASLKDRVDLMRELAESTSTVNEGVERQKEVVRLSQERWMRVQKRLKMGRMVKAMFVSDLHFPHTNWAAVELMLMIAKYVQPDLFTLANDLFDFEGYGRWADTRPPAARLWGDDITKAIKLLTEYVAGWSRAAPMAIPLILHGNHDLWMYKHIRSTARNGFSELNIAQWMETNYDLGAIYFGRGEKEDVIKLSAGLKWLHGASAATELKTVAIANQKVASGYKSEGENGIYYNTVGGHTHRAGEVEINGVKHWNSGTLSTQDTYMKHKPHWDTAIVINQFDPNSRFTLGQVVEFLPYKGHLTARYDGVQFDVPLP